MCKLTTWGTGGCNGDCTI